MATVPSSGTNIRLLSGVPFANDYKHTRWFDTQDAQTSYFLGKPLVHSLTNATFQKIEGKNVFRVDKHIDSLWNVNYAMFQNTSYNVKWFYAFVTKLEYKNDRVTHVHFEIDVLNTWRFVMDFKPSFVIREHCKLWNSDGTPVINTVDEGLDYGSVYETVDVNNFRPHYGIYYLVIVTQKAMHYAMTDYHDKIEPVLNGLPNPLTTYVHPFKLDGTSPNVKVGGVDHNPADVMKLLKALYSSDDSVGNIASLYITEYVGANFQYDNATDTLSIDDTSFARATIADLAESDDVKFKTLAVKEIPSYVSLSQKLGNKYEGYKPVTESKLLMYPYTSLVLDDFKGNRQVLKNEYIKDKEINISVKGSMGTSNKVVYSVGNYLIEASEGYNTTVEMENSLINNNPNDIAILSDYLTAYLQGNRNQLQTQKESILFNGQMDALGSGVAMFGAGQRGNVLGASQAGINMAQGAGNTVLQLQAMESKKQDIKNLPPQLVKMGSNTHFDYGNNIQGLYIVKKQITAEYRKKLTDFFNMYGYKLHETKVPNFHTRRYWNYVQTADCVILGNIANEDMVELKAVFNNGITLWHDDNIGDYSRGNEVI